jgi:beta-carotene 15,15'-dioxygenase
VSVGVAVGLLPPGAATTVVFVICGIGLAAGLPHGAIDHELTAALSRRPPWLIAAAYAATALLAYVLLATAGPIAWVAMIVISVVHFGLGEVQLHRSLDRWEPGPLVWAAVAVSGTGALLLPLARSGDALRTVAATISPGLALALDAPWLRTGMVVTWAAAAVVAAAASLRARRPLIALDIVLIGALGAFAPPLMAFATWFGGWHSLRHVGRLLTLDPRSARLLAAGRPGRAVALLTRRAAWPTAAALTVLTTLIVYTATSPDLAVSLAQTLQVLLALTIPHMLITGWIDVHRTARRDAVDIS